MKYIGNLSYIGIRKNYWKIPKIITKDHGFLIEKEYVSLGDIKSVFYLNRYSPYDSIFFLPGWSGFEILTKNERIYFSGEHYSLQDFFNKTLEKENITENNITGNIKRWKEHGQPYTPVTLHDFFLKKYLENWARKNINTKLVYLLFSAFIILIISLLIFRFL